MPRTVTNNSRGIRRRWIRVLLIAVGGMVALVALAIYLAVRTPSWYEPQPPPQQEADKQRVRNLLTDAEQAFTHSLIAGKPFTYRIYDEYLNDWLALRYEIYPRIDDHLPVRVRDPFIRILPGRILIGARGEFGGLDGVFSAELLPTFEDDATVLRLGKLSCGSLPAPMIPEAWRKRARLSYDDNEAWSGSPAIHGDLDRGLRVGAAGRWQNGGVRYRVTDVRTLDGVLELDVTPLPR